MSGADAHANGNPLSTGRLRVRRVFQLLAVALGISYAAFNPAPEQAVILACVPLLWWVFVRNDVSPHWIIESSRGRRPSGRLLFVRLLRPYLLPFGLPCAALGIALWLW